MVAKQKEKEEESSANARTRRTQAKSKRRGQATPSLHPQGINKTNWYYEEKTGIILVHEVREPIGGDYIRTDQIRIPWSKLEKSHARCRQGSGTLTRQTPVDNGSNLKP